MFLTAVSKEAESPEGDLYIFEREDVSSLDVELDMGKSFPDC